MYTLLSLTIDIGGDPLLYIAILDLLSFIHVATNIQQNNTTTFDTFN